MSASHPEASGKQPYPPLPYAYFTVGMIMLAYIFAFVDRVALGLVVDPIRRDPWHEAGTAPRARCARRLKR